MEQSSELINIRLPVPIVKWLDSLVAKGIYKSRSEAIRDFVRSCVLEAGGAGRE